MLRHRALLAVLFFALCLRVLVPAGWMPSATGGGFAIEPCPAAAPAPSLHGPGHHHHGASDHRSHGTNHDGECAFSPLLAGVAELDTAPTLAAPARVEEAATSTTAAAHLKTGPPALPPPATGPPSFA